MIKRGSYQAYIVRIKDWWVRIVWQGKNKKEQRKHMKTFAEDIVHLGTLPLPIKYDLDECGEGTKIIGKSRLISCKHCKQMITKPATEETTLELQRKSIVSFIESQEELLRKDSLKTLKPEFAV